MGLGNDWPAPWGKRKSRWIKQKPRPLNLSEKDAFKKRYDHIVAAGYLANTVPEPVEKRGWPKQSKAGNMLRHLSEHRHEVLAFMEGYRFAFDNNQAERDLRMTKLRHKFSSVFRSTKSADMLSRTRGYISTARNNSVSFFSDIIGVFHSRPFILKI